MVSGVSVQVSGIQKLECGKYEKAHGVCMRSNLIFFVLVLRLVLVIQQFMDDEGRVRRRRR